MKFVQLRDIQELKGEKFALWQLLNPATVGTKNLMLFLVAVDIGGCIPPHTHGPAEATIYVLRGKGEFEVDGEKRTFSADTSFSVPIGSTIGLENKGHTPLRFLIAMSPPISVEVCPICGIMIPGSEA